MKPLLAALVLLPALAFGQATPPKVSLDARGEDVREVIATLFAQVHRPYALDATVKGRLYVTFESLPFPKALDIVLTQANLAARDRDGVTFIVPRPRPVAVPAAVPTTKPATKPTAKPAPVETAPKPAVLSKAVLTRKVTTRLSRAPLADVFAAMGDQAKVTIEVGPDVPAYRVDAFFLHTSLHFALDRVCKAAGLKYTLEADRIVIARA